MFSMELFSLYLNQGQRSGHSRPGPSAGHVRKTFGARPFGRTSAKKPCPDKCPRDTTQSELNPKVMHYACTSIWQPWDNVRPSIHQRIEGINHSCSGCSRSLCLFRRSLDSGLDHHRARCHRA